MKTANTAGMSTARETDLYLPIKSFLEDQGYVVKSEVGAADVVAIRGAEPPVVVELKLGFSLALRGYRSAMMSILPSRGSRANDLQKQSKITRPWQDVWAWG